METLRMGVGVGGGGRKGFLGGSDGKRIFLQCGRPEFDP